MSVLSSLLPSGSLDRRLVRLLLYPIIERREHDLPVAAFERNRDQVVG